MLYIYLFRGNPFTILIWLALALVWVLGGWLIVYHAFNLERRERTILGAAVGLVGYIGGVNLLAHWLPPEVAFGGSAFLVLAIGVLYARRSTSWIADLRDFAVWQEIVAGLFLFLLFVSLEAGLGIFDDRKNLSIISTMAAGDIPPHDYLNSQVILRYHYGSQLIGASLMRLGGLFPWSAFDVSKATVMSLSLLVMYRLWRRITPNRGWAVVSLLAVFFAGGTRYLMLLLPKAILLQIDTQVQLIGSSANVGLPLSKALLTGWAIDDGPPFPYPFAFQNGLFRTMAMEHAGTGALSGLIFVSFWLLANRSKGWDAMPIFAILLSVWALIWETSYALFVIGVFACAIILRLRGQHLPRNMRILMSAAALSIPIVLLQGGTITDVARDVVVGLQGSDSLVGGAVSGAGFGLRWPPAIISAHLGELPISSPIAIVVAVLEIGPIVLLAPWITFHTWKEMSDGDWFVGGLILGAGVGFLIPIFITYRSDRDITRLTGYALDVWLFLLVRMLWTYEGRWRERFLAVGAASLGLMGFGGVVLAGTQLTAIPERMTTAHFTELDSRVAAAVWDELPPGSEILDHRGWRAVALTGRLTHPFDFNSIDPLAECGDAGCLIEGVLDGGFEFLYYDNWWLEVLSEAERNSLESQCISVVTDQRYGRESYRRLLDLRPCR
jgi:hypothetical protein